MLLQIGAALLHKAADLQCPVVREPVICALTAAPLGHLRGSGVGSSGDTGAGVIELDWTLAARGPVVQANMDHYRDDASKRNRRNRQRHDWQDICYSRCRRTFARMAIGAVPNQRLSREDLWKLMSVSPCLAEDTV